MWKNTAILPLVDILHSTFTIIWSLLATNLPSWGIIVLSFGRNLTSLWEFQSKYLKLSLSGLHSQFTSPMIKEEFSLPFAMSKQCLSRIQKQILELQSLLAASRCTQAKLLRTKWWERYKCWKCSYFSPSVSPLVDQIGLLKDLPSEDHWNSTGKKKKRTTIISHLLFSWLEEEEKKIMSIS